MASERRAAVCADSSVVVLWQDHNEESNDSGAAANTDQTRVLSQSDSHMSVHITPSGLGHEHKVTRHSTM